ncbi:MAG: hypothetical protein IPL46_18655 [Saprospiraceae bacterium]|nr:hypothetical protein [Saprospiraceae bacterium]
MNVLKFKSIYFLLFFSFFLTTAFGQKVSQIRAVKGFKGEVGAWGVKHGDVVSPAKDWIFMRLKILLCS